MKKIILTLFLAMTVFVSTAQDKGFFISLSGSLGANNISYSLDNGNESSPKLGFGGNIGVQYYFTPNWGLGTGIGISYYHSKGSYSNSWMNDVNHYEFQAMVDDDPRFSSSNYHLRLELNNWTETQEAYFLEIPLMLMYQTKWGKSEKFGMYFGIGGKLQIPVSQSYTTERGSSLAALGYYPDYDLTLGSSTDPKLNQHGFGMNDKIAYSGDIDMKSSFAATGEIGLLASLTRRLDLTVGAYLDYGFTNIKDGNKTENGYLISPENGTNTIHPSAYVGDHLQYNGLINSAAVDKAKLFSVGGKIGLRFKIGKLKKLQSEIEKEAETPIRNRVDTVYVINMVKCPPPEIIVKNENILPQNEKKTPTEEEINVLTVPIFFNLNSDKLLPASIIILNRKVEILNRYPKLKLLITGNTCDLGSNNKNIELGQKRANAAMQYLQEHGIGKERLSTASQSFTHPIVPNNSEENREKNRRCDFFPFDL